MKKISCLDRLRPPYRNPMSDRYNREHLFLDYALIFGVFFLARLLVDVDLVAQLSPNVSHRVAGDRSRITELSAQVENRLNTALGVSLKYAHHVLPYIDEKIHAVWALLIMIQIPQNHRGYPETI